jgi:hypothetical protein
MHRTADKVHREVQSNETEVNPALTQKAPNLSWMLMLLYFTSNPDKVYKNKNPCEICFNNPGSSYPSILSKQDRHRHPETRRYKM